MRNHAKHRLRPAKGRRLAATGLALAAVSAVAVSGASAARPHVADKVVVDALSLTPSSPAAGASVTATARLHATTTLAVQALTIAVRSASGAHFDFSATGPTTLSTSERTFTPPSRTFAAGAYSYFVSYERNGAWHRLTPTGTFTSNGATVTPTSTPTPTASPTSSSSPSSPSSATPTPSGSASPSASASASASASQTPAGSPTAVPTTSAPTAAASTAATPTQTASAPASPSASSTAGAVPLGIPGAWHESFADEFNGSSLDASKWTPNWLGCATCTTAPVNSYEEAAYAPSQVSVSGGSLHLTAAQQSTTVGGKTFPYRSGMVESNGKAQFTYGAFEARIYLPAGNTGIANWPAFWTDGQNWPTDGEMDVMEGLEGSACYHFHSPAGGPGDCATGDFSGWHTYGADWEPGSVTYYYDGKEVGKITTGITSAPQYLILNNAVTASGGQVVAPADMQVDYVRVWQH